MAAFRTGTHLSVEHVDHDLPEEDFSLLLHRLKHPRRANAENPILLLPGCAYMIPDSIYP
jgi:hypothetical protein